jgi:hypothetical protein
MVIVLPAIRPTRHDSRAIVPAVASNNPASAKITIVPPRPPVQQPRSRHNAVSPARFIFRRQNLPLLIILMALPLLEEACGNAVIVLEIAQPRRIYSANFLELAMNY